MYIFILHKKNAKAGVVYFAKSRRDGEFLLDRKFDPSWAYQFCKQNC